MVIFEPGKEIEKDVVRLVTSVRQRRNSDFPSGKVPQTFGFCAPMLYHLRETAVSEVYYEVQKPRVLHTA